MKTVTATELRTNVYQLLDEVLNSGSPIEVKRAIARCASCPLRSLTSSNPWFTGQT